MQSWIQADWPVPSYIRTASTLRYGGVGAGPYASFNLSTRVGDDLEIVLENRSRLKMALDLPSEPVWLNQEHGNRILHLENTSTAFPSADAAWTSHIDVVCAVLTADCLPILLYSPDGNKIAAVHAGWRGLVSGIITSTINVLGTSNVIAWLGPAIGEKAFEVGSEVRDLFLEKEVGYDAYFHRVSSKKWHTTLYGLARAALSHVGVKEIYGGRWCTYSQPDDFFSYRRETITGRMATLIWRVLPHLSTAHTE